MPNISIKNRNISRPERSANNVEHVDFQRRERIQQVNNSQAKPISLAEILLIGQIVLWSDIIGFIIIEDFGLIDIFIFPMTQFYFRYKGVKSTYDLIGNIAECIPGVGILPLRTIAFGITVFAANHPKAFKVGINLASKTMPGGAVAQTAAKQALDKAA